MGKVLFITPDQREVVAGWDAPFQTWFAQLFAADAGINDEPLKTLGYHPTERALSGPDVEHGPYPIRSYAELQDHLTAWGIEVPAKSREAIEADGKKTF